jgi:myo-inositol 2-dehydrogenase / D-chiro-inositol 1-dehydrogenase
MIKTRFGLIGYGRWGKHHARAVFARDDSELVAVSAVSEESCRDAAETYGVHTYRDYAEMLRQEKLDVVSIVLPNHLHETAAVAALQSGAHVFLEKPMALSVPECDKIINAQENGRLLYVGFEKRVSPLWAAVRRHITAGRIGRPLAAFLELYRKPYRSGSGGWRHDTGRIGSWILEEPVHFMDLACWYMGEEPESIYAAANSVPPKGPGFYDNMSFVLSFSGGVYAAVNQTLIAWGHHSSARIMGTKGSLFAYWHGAEDESTQPEYGIELFDGESNRPVAVSGTPGEFFEISMEVDEMVRALKGGTPVALATPTEGRRAVALCTAAETSIREGHTVTL